MSLLSDGLLRAGLALKLDQIKRATRSYLRDRTSQLTGTATSYVIAVGLFCAAGIFLIMAAVVGAAALFHWIHISYGIFTAFGAIAGLLLLTCVICIAAAVMSLRRRQRSFPSLTSRMRVAIKSHPPHDAAQPPTDRLFSPSGERSKLEYTPPSFPTRQKQAGLILVAALLGWAVARRRATAALMLKPNYPAA